MSTDTCTTNKCKRQRGLFMQQQNAFYLNAFLLCIRQSHDAGELARLYCAAHLWNDALLACFWSSHHRVTFSCARLSISEDAHVVSVDGMLQHFDSNVLIDTLLTRKLSVVWLHRTNTSRTIDHPQAAAASLTVLWLKKLTKMHRVSLTRKYHTRKSKLFYVDSETVFLVKRYTILTLFTLSTLNIIKRI